MYIYIHASKANIKSLITLPKRAIRVISNFSFRAHTSPIFKKCRYGIVLKISDITKLQILRFVHKTKHNGYPAELKEFYDSFTFLCQNNLHATRSTGRLYVPQYRINIRKSAIKINGTRFWNTSLSSIASVNKSIQFDVIELFCVFVALL